RDTTAPTVGAVANKTVEATSPAGAFVTFTKPTANDSVDGPVAVTCDHDPSGETYALGSTTTVTCSATVAHGNTGASSLTISVVDTTGPAITTPSNQTVAGTPTGASVPYTASAHDVNDNIASFSCTATGATTFTDTSVPSGQDASIDTTASPHSF